MIKAIQTKYNGYYFRSRLEARWAVFFDSLLIPYQYEKEGFILDGDISYLPDFYLPEFGGGMWIEIKGKVPTNLEIEKAYLLAKQTNQHVAIIWGNIGQPLLEIRPSAKRQFKWRLHDGSIGIVFNPVKNKSKNNLIKDNVYCDMSVCAWSLQENDLDTLDFWPIYVAESELPPQAKIGDQKIKDIFASIGQFNTYITPIFPSGFMFRSYMGPGRSPFAPMLTMAYTNARSARFEHRETP